MYSIALRLGSNIFKQHPCPCNAIVNENGHLGLSCTLSKGRLSRHGELDDQVIQRHLLSFNVGTSCLICDDRKQPDGITLNACAKGQKLVPYGMELVLTH